MKLHTLKQLFCVHRWKITQFQALSGGTSYRCAKCGSIATDHRLALRKEAPDAN